MAKLRELLTLVLVSEQWAVSAFLRQVEVGAAVLKIVGRTTPSSEPVGAVVEFLDGHAP